MKIIKDITQTKTIEVCSDDIDRCSRDCPFCRKSSGNYRCFLQSDILCGDYEEIDGIDGGKEDRDWDTKGDGSNGGLSSAESYGFTRTNYCKKTFELEPKE